MSRVTWITQGLALELTGIERFCLTLADELVAHGIIRASELTAVVDPDASWVEPLGQLGAQVMPIPSNRARGPRVPAISSARLVHNFGGGLFPSAVPASATAIYSVYDWGPFRDRRMPFRARLAWAQAIARGLARANVVHYLNPRLPSTQPRLLSKAKSAVVAYSSSVLAATDHSWPISEVSRPCFALFVGSAVPRKRLRQVVAVAAEQAIPVTLVGSGTEQYADAPGVTALGRVDDQTLADLLASCGALLLLSEYEGFGIPVLEAASRGIMSVVSAEVASTLPHGLRSCVLVADPFATNDLARAIRIAFTKRGMARFSGESLLQPLLDVYAGALA